MELILVGEGGAPKPVEQDLLARIFERAWGNGWKPAHAQTEGRTAAECFIPYFSGIRVDARDARSLVSALSDDGWDHKEALFVAWLKRNGQNGFEIQTSDTGKASAR